MGAECRRSVAALIRLRQELSEDRMAMAVRTAVLALAMVLAVALAWSCDVPEAGTRAEQVPLSVRDSAGVVVVENEVTPQEVPEWRLAAEPDFSIGVAEGAPELQLFRVDGAVTLEDGAIAVMNTGTREVRIFEPDGTFRLSMGRSGEGPGEFGSPVGPWVLGDRLYVWDRLPDQDLGPPRVTLFTLEGGLVSTRRFEAVASTLNQPVLAHVFDDGSLLVRRDEREYLPSGYHLMDLSLWRMDIEGNVLDSLPREPLQEMGLLELRTGVRSLQPRRFAPRTSIAGAGTGYWVGRGDGYEIRRHGPGGALERIVRWSGPDRTVPADLIREARQQAGEVWANPDALEFSETFPAYQGLFVDRAGNVWVDGYQGQDGTQVPSRWIVFDPDGRLIARATLLPHGGPRSFVREIGEDWVLGVAVDDLGVERVVRHRLQR